MPTHSVCAKIALAAAVCAAPASLGGVCRPDRATAESEYSSSYDIGNAIDGSGLPSGFIPGNSHGTYAVNNHWTTQAGALGQGRSNASFFFDNGTTIGAFHLWNHRSNGVAADPGYAVTLFDLILRDQAGEVIFQIIDVAALPNVLTAQTYSFTTVPGVYRVDFRIKANNGSPNYTGVAEVGFDNGLTPCPADLDCDRAITTGDLVLMLARFGQAGLAGQSGDLNQDGVVNTTDLTQLLVAFGGQCTG